MTLLLELASKESYTTGWCYEAVVYYYYYLIAFAFIIVVYYILIVYNSMYYNEFHVLHGEASGAATAIKDKKRSLVSEDTNDYPRAATVGTFARLAWS